MPLVVIDTNELNELIYDAVTRALQSVEADKPSEIFTISETAEYLKISDQTLRRMIREKEIKSFKARGQYLIRQMDIDQWIRKQLKDAAGDQ